MHLLAAAETGDWSTIGGSFQQSMTEMWTKLAGFIPNLIGMLLILVVGYLVSKVLQWTAAAVLKRIRFDRAAEKTGLSESMGKIGIKRTASEIVGLLVFWFFMLTFVISAADALGLENVTKTIDSFVGYLPKVIGATVILVVGLLIAGFVRTAVRTALERIGIEYASAASKLAYSVLIVLIGSLAFGQLQIEITLVNRVIEIVLLAAGAALALALGFGTRDIARHVVAGVYARESFKVGTHLRFGEDEGTVEAVTAVNTRVRTPQGEKIYIPNGQLVESLVREETSHE
jgi:small-conductance mechanosensitive channel